MSVTPCRTRNPAFLVEGHLEQAFVQNACPRSPVRRTGCNGDDVSVGAMAKRIGTLGRLLQRRFNPLVIVFDRERRDAPCEILEAELRSALSPELLRCDVIIGIPDRDIETWMLADPELMRECMQLPSDTLLTSCEGEKGKSQIKYLMGKKGPYVETVHGPGWLKRVRPTELQKNSKSFARFVNALPDLDCWWLKEERLI